MKLVSNVYGERSSDRPPVVVLHGLLGSADNWHTVCRRLSGRFELHALDLRNHGRSPHSAEMDYPSMAADVLDYIASIDTGTVDIIGHSMGGKVGMEAALSHPAIVRKLVVEDMVPFATSEDNRRFVQTLRDLPVADLVSRREAEEFISDHVESRSMALFLLKNLIRDNDGVYRLLPNVDAILSNYGRLWEGLPGGRRYPGDVLFIRGERSGYIDDSDMNGIETLFPAAELVTVPDAGHWIHAERMDDFLRIVHDFLDRS